MTGSIALAVAVLTVAAPAATAQPTQNSGKQKQPAPVSDTAKHLLATVCLAPARANEPVCQKQDALNEDEAWLILWTACKSKPEGTTPLCQGFKQQLGGVLIHDTRTSTWEFQREGKSYPLEYDVAGTPTLRLKPGDARDLKIVVEGVSPLVYSAKPGTPKEEDLAVVANLKTFLSLAATGIQGVIQTAAFSAAPGLTQSSTPPAGNVDLFSDKIAALGNRSMGRSGRPAPPPPPPCEPEAPQVATLSSLIVGRNGQLLTLNQAIRALSKELDAVETARRAFVKEAQKAEDDETVMVASLKPADSTALDAAFTKFQRLVDDLTASTAQLISCQPAFSAYATLLSAPKDTDVVTVFAEALKTAVSSCQSGELAAALNTEAKSAACAVKLGETSLDTWLKRHGAAMKPLADRLSNVETAEASVKTAIDKVVTAKPQVLGAADTLKRQIDQAVRHSWDGKLIREIVVTRQNPKLPWNKVQSHSIVVKSTSPYAKELTLKHPSDETHEYKLESATGQILGYSVGVIYTPLYESTWTAASASDNTKVIAETKRDTRAGDLAAFLNYRFLEHRPTKRPRKAEVTFDLGVGLTSGRPAFFLGPGLEIAHSLRIGAGWAPERVSTLAPGQTVNVTKVSANDDIRTVTRFEKNNWYFSLSFSLDSLSLFNKS